MCNTEYIFAMAFDAASMLKFNCLLYSLISFVSYFVYRTYRWVGGVHSASFCFYDNFYFGHYYRFASIIFLIYGCLLFRKISADNVIFWRSLKIAQFCSLFLESEAIMQFVLVSRDIEYMAENDEDQQLIFSMIFLGVFRWALALFGTNHLMLAIETAIFERYGYSVSGRGVSRNRLKLNLTYGWFSQILSDFIVAHYLAYVALYTPESFAFVGFPPGYGDDNSFSHARLDTNISAKYLSLQRIKHNIAVCLSILFYAYCVRPEVTMFNFVY